MLIEGNLKMKGYIMRKFTNKFFGGVFTLTFVGRESVELIPEGSQKVITVSLQRFVQEFEECHRA